MPVTTAPYDGNFTTFIDGHASPGAADINRIQNDIGFLSSTPSCRIGRSDTILQNSGLAFTDLQWNVTVYKTDVLMTGVGPATPGLGINFRYPGEWLCGMIVRSQYNNTAGAGQIQLVKGYSISGSDFLLDQDIGLCNAAVPLTLRCVTPCIITAADVTNGVFLKGQYVQNSGGTASIVGSGLGNPVYPQLWARWVGTGSV